MKGDFGVFYDKCVAYQKNLYFCNLNNEKIVSNPYKSLIFNELRGGGKSSILELGK